jgi:RNA polymerase sigma-70 factor (ECF subfamily)
MEIGPNHDERAWLLAAIDRYQGQLTRYATKILGNVEHGRDVVQETFLQLCKAKPSSVQDHLVQWLFTVCRNKALDTRKKEARMFSLSTNRRNKNPDGDTTVAQLEFQEKATHAQNILKSLPANQQEVIRLKFQNDFSYKEISKITGFSVSNVGFLVHSGIKSIRGKIPQQENGEKKEKGGAK